jgi:hypothetical protein
VAEERARAAHAAAADRWDRWQDKWKDLVLEAEALEAELDALAAAYSEARGLAKQAGIGGALDSPYDTGICWPVRGWPVRPDVVAIRRSSHGGPAVRWPERVYLP